MAKMKVKIEFIDVGRQRFSGVVAFEVGGAPEGYELSADDIAVLALKVARKHLISRDVSTAYDPETNEGTIYAGFHAVGKFRVIQVIDGRTAGLIKTI